MKSNEAQQWGFLRETREMALRREVATDIVVGGNKSRIRPDYRSETLKLIIEFDGVQHYTKPSISRKTDATRRAMRRMATRWSGLQTTCFRWSISRSTRKTIRGIPTLKAVFGSDTRPAYRAVKVFLEGRGFEHRRERHKI